MLTIASDRELMNEQIRTSPTPLPDASYCPSVLKSTEVTLILHQPRKFVRGQSTHLRSDGLGNKIGFHRYGDPIFLQYHCRIQTPLEGSGLPALLCTQGHSPIPRLDVIHSVVLLTPYGPPTCEDM